MHRSTRVPLLCSAAGWTNANHLDSYLWSWRRFPARRRRILPRGRPGWSRSGAPCPGTRLGFVRAWPAGGPPAGCWPPPWRSSGPRFLDPSRRKLKNKHSYGFRWAGKSRCGWRGKIPTDVALDHGHEGRSHLVHPNVIAARAESVNYDLGR